MNATSAIRRRGSVCAPAARPRVAGLTAPRRRPGGFSLAELVVAIGIMGIGMTMAAALFPAGLIGVQSCQDDINGTVICQNVQAVVQEHRDVIRDYLDGVAAGQFWALADEDETRPLPFPLIPYQDMRYPRPGLPIDRTRSGFVLLGRRVDNDGNPATPEGYQLIAIAYRKSARTNRAVIFQPTTPLMQPITDAARLNDWPADSLLPDAIVISQLTGQYARIVRIDDDDAFLGSPLVVPAGGGWVWGLREQTPGGNLVRSPAIAVLSFWTDFQ